MLGKKAYCAPCAELTIFVPHDKISTLSEEEYYASTFDESVSQHTLIISWNDLLKPKGDLS